MPLRTAAAVVLSSGLLLTAGPVAAQSKDWSGYYIGADFGQTGGRNGEISATLDPARDPRLTYIVPPETARFSRERNLSREVSGSLRAGRLFNAGGLVWGVEGQAGVADLQETFVIGPVQVPPGARTNTVPGLGSYNNSRDSLSADLQIDAVASLRARVGLPVGDRMLVSAFAGPSVASTSLSLSQTSQIVIIENVLGPFGFNQVVTVVDRTTRGGDEDEFLFGGTVGGAVDVALTERWVAHAETGVSFYDAIEARSGGAGGSSGGDSAFSYEPVLYSFSLGVAYRF